MRPWPNGGTGSFFAPISTQASEEAGTLSGRASQFEAMTLSTGQWGLGKNLDNSGVIGSFIVTPDAVDAPAGVGFGRKPRLYAKPGSVAEVGIHGVCTVTSPIVDNAQRR